ncbi:MAG: hypothetical protein KBB88_00810 [Candidatus Pacebacteria bacterium]|nr:hypothetical protein [Candidatus Paceibacterota bacterium]
MEKSSQSPNVCVPNESLLIHQVLAYSYLVYFAGMVVGLFLDVVFGWKIAPSEFLQILGFIFLAGGSALIVWAQKTSRTTAVKRNCKEPSVIDFFCGPYRYTRAPTHLGLFLLVVGLGLFLNSLSVVIITFCAYAFSRIFFLPREEKRLLEKYGSVYVEYLKKVRI